MTNSFLKAVLERLPEDQYDLSQICFILPSQRAGLELKKLIAKRSSETIRLPITTTLNSWKEDISRLNHSVRAENYWLLYKAYSDAVGKTASKFENFLSWADVLLSDFNDIDNQLLNNKQVFKDLRAYAEIEHFSFLENELTLRQENYRKFWLSLSEIYEKFTNSMLLKSIGHSGLVSRVASEKIDEYLKRNEFYFLVAGFNALSTSEKKILQKVRETKRGDVFFDSDAMLTKNNHFKAGFFLRKFKKEAFGKFIESEESLLTKELKFRVIHCPSALSQAQTVIQEIAGLNPEMRNETVVILPDEEFLVHLLSLLQTEELDANITMGIGLRNSTFYAWLERVLSSKEESIPFSGKDPFLQLLEAIDAFSEFEHRAMLYGKVTGLPELDVLINALHKFLSEYGTNNLNLNQAIAGCDIVLRIIDQLKNLGAKELESYTFIILKEIASSSINIISDPDQKLQIMGLLESRCLGFKNVLICSALEEFLPGKLQSDSFLPFEIRKHHGLPGKYLTEAAFAYNFYRLTHDAEKLTLIYYDKDSSLSASEKSRYINQIIYDLADENPNIQTEIRSDKIQLPQQRNQTSQLSKTPELIGQIYKYLENGVSASSINRYFEDPVEWYYSYVLRLEEPKRDVLDVAGFGTLVHDCLDKLFKPQENKSIDSVILQNLKAKSEETLKEVFRSELADTPLERGEARLSLEMALKMINNFLDKEAAQLKKYGPKRYVEGEKRLMRTTVFELNQKPVDVKFVGQADKIEEFDGLLHIVDYKTGSVNVNDLKIKDWELEQLRGKPKSLQLFMYQYLAGNYWPEKTSIGQIISLPAPSKNNLIAQVENSDGFDEKAFEGILLEVFEEMINPELPLVKNDDYRYAVFDT